MSSTMLRCGEEPATHVFLPFLSARLLIQPTLVSLRNQNFGEDLSESQG